MKYILLVLTVIVCFAYAGESNVIKPEPKECKDELAKAIIISTGAFELARANSKDGKLDEELSYLEESAHIFIRYYNSRYKETISDSMVKKTLKEIKSKCEDIGCMLEAAANHLEKMYQIGCDITSYEEW